jgi:hypothetical protein
MTPRQSLIAALLMVACAAPATAAPKPGATAAARANSLKGNAAAIGNAPAGTPSTAAAAPAGSRQAGAPRSGVPVKATGTSGQRSATAHNPSAASTRTLDDIHIEGEIPVPQVLFITTRDQRRFLGFQHRRYLRTSRMIGEDTALPSRIIVTGAATLPERSHSDE